MGLPENRQWIFSILDQKWKNLVHCKKQPNWWQRCTAVLPHQPPSPSYYSPLPPSPSSSPRNLRITLALFSIYSPAPPPLQKKNGFLAWSIREGRTGSSGSSERGRQEEDQWKSSLSQAWIKPWNLHETLWSVDIIRMFCRSADSSQLLNTVRLLFTAEKSAVCVLNKTQNWSPLHDG